MRFLKVSWPNFNHIGAQAIDILRHLGWINIVTDHNTEANFNVDAYHRRNSNSSLTQKESLCYMEQGIISSNTLVTL